MEKEKKTSLPVKQLRENGPTSSAELPYRPDIGKQNVRRLYAEKGHTNARCKSTAVYYLDSLHSEVEVVREYINVNERMLSEKDRTALTTMFRRAGPEFREAWEKIADEYDLKKRHGTTMPPGENTLRDCPYCGSEVKSIPSHLRHQCSEM